MLSRKKVSTFGLKDSSIVYNLTEFFLHSYFTLSFIFCLVILHFRIFKSVVVSIMASISKLGSNVKAFDFLTLPYVCQKRFAEICDRRTLEKFVKINSRTTELVNGCHFVKKNLVNFNSGIQHFTVACFCKTDNHRNCRELEALKLKSYAAKNVSIVVTKKFVNTSFFQTLPLKYEEAERIRVATLKMGFQDWMELIKYFIAKPNLKVFEILCRVSDDFKFEEFKVFFETLLSHKSVSIR